MVHLEAHFEKHPAGSLFTPVNSADYGDDAFPTEARNINVTYDNTVFMHGGMSLLFSDSGTTGNGYAAEYFGALNATKAAVRLYIRWQGLPPTNSGHNFLALSSSDSTYLSSTVINDDGTLSFYTDTPGNAFRSRSTVALKPLTWYRVEHAISLATTGGQVKWAVYAGDTASSPLLTYDTGATLSFTSGTAKKIYSAVIGKNNSGFVMPKFNIDDIGMMDGTTTYLGPYTPGPVLVAQPNQGVAVIDCTKSYVGVTGDTLTYSVPAGSNVTQPAPGIFLIPEVSSTTALTITVTESNGQADSQTVKVPAQLPSGLGFRVKRFSSGTWVA